MALPINISPFPNEFDPPEQKETPEYQAAVAAAIWSRYLSGYTLLAFGNQDWYRLMHLYCAGQQPFQQYIPWYRNYGTPSSRENTNGITQSVSENRRKGFQNLSFEINSPAKKEVSQLKAILDQADYMIDIHSDTKDALTKKEYEKWKLWTGTKINNPLLKSLGLQPRKYEWEPQNKAELDAYEKYHGFKLPFETGLLKIINHTLQISNYKELFNEWKDSAIETNFLCGRVCHNSEGAVTVEYFHPSNFITAYLPKQKMDTPPFAGHSYRRQIMEIEGALRAQGANDSDILQLAGKNCGINGYSDPSNYDFNQTDPSTNRFLWYEWYVPVLHYEQRSNDENRFRKYKRGDGEVKYARERPKRITKEADPITGKPGRSFYTYVSNNNKDTEEYDVLKNQCVYEGDWVIGTQWILNYGRKKNVLKNSDGSTALSYFYYQIPGASIAQRWKPILDQYQLAWLKKQSAVLAARPDGQIVDTGILAQQDLGFGGESSVAEILRIDTETGNLFVKTTSPMMNNRMNVANSIVPRPGGPGRQLEEWDRARQSLLQDMRDVSGMTSAVSGSGDQPELNGLMQGEMLATNNALYEIMWGLTCFKEFMAQKIATYARLLLQFDPKSREYYSGLIGENVVDEINLFKDISLNQSGIIMRAAPTKERKDYLKGLVMEAQKPGQNGKRGIEPADAMWIEEQIDNGYIQLAASHLTLATYRNADIQAKMDSKNIQENAQVQMQSNQVAEAAKLKSMATKIEMEAKAKSILQKEEGQIKSGLQAQAHVENLEELELEGELEQQNNVQISGQL